MIGVAVIATSPMARARLEALVAGQRGLRLASSWFPTTITGDHAPAAQAEPDVVMVDPGAEPIEAVLRTLSRGARLPPVVVVGGDIAAGAVTRLLRAGVRAVLPPDASAQEITASIAAVAAGLVVFHPSGTPLKVGGTRGSRHVASGPRASPLTPRELEVLTMMAEGVGNRTIARRLGISSHTVKFHIAAILDKLNARSRTEAVTVGLRRGLLMV